MDIDLEAALRDILTPLGVSLDGTDETTSRPIPRKQVTPTVTMFQTSRDHYGTHYRLDLVGCVPELRVWTPSEVPPNRTNGYLVVPAQDSDLLVMFSGKMAKDREAAHHLLFAAGEILKERFWNEYAFCADDGSPCAIGKVSVVVTLLV